MRLRSGHPALDNPSQNSMGRGSAKVILRFVLPFDGVAGERLADTLGRIRKAARFTAAILDLPEIVDPALPLVDARSVLSEEELSEPTALLDWGGRFRAGILEALAERPGPAPRMEFDPPALVPDPRNPKALILPLKAARRGLRPYHVALQRLVGYLPDSLPFPSLTLARLPSARGTAALHSVLTRSVPAQEIAFTPTSLVLVQESGVAEERQILGTWPLVPSP